MSNETGGHPLLAALLREEPVQTARAVFRGHPCHLVGGVIRDRLLGLPSPDIDLVVAGSGEELGRELAETLQARFVDLGRKDFASYRIVAGSLILDLWDRKDMPLVADLERRDFTVNSIALDIHSGNLVDPFDGLGDLSRRLMRATTARCFIEDPLRLLRLIRFGITLPGFRIDTTTARLGRESASAIDRTADERIRAEIELLLSHPDRARGTALLEDLGLYPRLWSGGGDGITPANETPVKTQMARLVSWSQELDGLQSDTSVDPLSTSLTILFAASGGTNERQGIRVCGSRNPLLTRRTRATVERLLNIKELPTEEPAGRWFLHQWQQRWLDAVAVWGVLGWHRTGPQERLERARWLVELICRSGAEIFNPPRLLDGHQVENLLGLPPGPRLGSALTDLRRRQIEGRIRTRDEAIAYLRSWTSERPS